jgi:hypothetical protein
MRPEAVIPRESVTKVAAGGFDYLFPRSSVTVIELRGK